MPYGGNARIELTGLSLLLESRLKPITAEMNSWPLRVNKSTWLVNAADAFETAQLLVRQCRQQVGDPYFRPNSPADCAKVLFTNRGVKPSRLSKTTKRASTDKDTLLELANQGDIQASAILAARSAITRWGQLRTWGKFADIGLVQSVWDSCGTPHGRYTSDSPCLCNRILPIRGTIEPDPGYSFLSVDLKMAELVTWASLSGDRTIARSFQQGRDFHQETAEIVKKAVPSWDLRGQDERAAGKTLNFAILYLMKASTLAQKLGCPIEVAVRIIKACHRRAPKATAYIEKTLARTKELGYASTYFGRRRFCFEYQDPNLSTQAAHQLEKTLWNHIVAGTSAEYLKRKQILVWEALRKAHFTPIDARLSLQIYDECVWHVRDSLLEKVQEIAVPIWLQREAGFLPFQATIQTGKSWEAVSK
jgi:DNA polymerase-1